MGSWWLCLPVRRDPPHKSNQTLSSVCATAAPSLGEHATVSSRMTLCATGELANVNAQADRALLHSMPTLKGLVPFGLAASCISPCNFVYFFDKQSVRIRIRVETPGFYMCVLGFQAGLQTCAKLELFGIFHEVMTVYTFQKVGLATFGFGLATF